MSTTDASTATSRSDPSRTATGSRGSAYAELSRQVRQARLLDRRRGYYARHAALLLLLCVAAAVAFFTFGDSWWQLAVAAFLAAHGGRAPDRTSGRGHHRRGSARPAA